MNGTDRKIEIFKPFVESFALMKKILFQPFDLTKWLLIGFAAFLSHFSGGTRFNLNFGNWNRAAWWSSTQQTPAQQLQQMPHWVIPLLFAVIPLILASIFVLMWLGARGRFMFIDCLVRNQGAIAEPWHEFKKEANSFFFFSLFIALIVITVLAVAFLPMLLPVILHGANAWTGFTFSLGLMSWLMLIFILAITWALISQLMVPVMYRRRCRAAEAFKEVITLISTKPAAIILYLLFLFALSIGIAFVACAAICVTCCIAAIPYIGSVILLPLDVLLYGYTLLFLKQFDADYDVWAGISQSAPPLPPSLLS
jgi:hypothetical protein